MNNQPNFSSPNQTQTPSLIELNHFVDYHYEIEGWYSLGHHEPEQFLAAVVQRQPNPYSEFNQAQVKLTWANFHDDDFDLINPPTAHAKAITLIEDW